MMATEVECPNCGCPDANTLDRYQWAGELMEKLCCNNCARIWTAKIPADPLPAPAPPEPDPEPVELDLTDAVIFRPLKCPQCGSKNKKDRSCPVQKDPNTPRTRYHLCRDCGRRFKSVEES